MFVNEARSWATLKTGIPTPTAPKVTADLASWANSEAVASLLRRNAAPTYVPVFSEGDWRHYVAALPAASRPPHRWNRRQGGRGIFSSLLPAAR